MRSGWNPLVDRVHLPRQRLHDRVYVGTIRSSVCIMLQTISIILSIAGLLACPYNCMAVPRTDRAAVGKTCGCGKASCGRDADHNEQSGSEQSKPADCDGCCSCACKAAIDTTPGRPSIELVTDLVSPACDLYDMRAHRELSAGVLANGDPLMAPPAVISGRGLRLQMDSLLL